jgi:hypothetical protein
VVATPELVDRLRIDHRSAGGDGTDGVDQVIGVGHPILQEIGPALGTTLQ